ncbi:LacI family DNA-binding transcriptional regulator [Enterococcus sp. BWR-S5]|uniref:LacI family DNA-binding transcriptional regulator n=1 Tax=Enterococcus sp. BWR-S5 TaxID=2787714 RepID=UPI0019238655|nr:LacI family DNA-binding transcriptional regulator [Enterococcus sp. BWR-S5]MBL1223655.1 LacI family DNA-binding transcriptional regulator [Enterococcus sp. BWR-S5]
MSRVTIKDIAEQAGVSKTIVSHYLNNNFKFMSEETKNRIAQIVKETNYIPRNSARNLKFKKVKVINIIVANISSSFSTNVIKYIDRKISSPSVQVIVSYSDDDGEKEKNLIEQAIASDVDGIVLFPTGTNTEYYRMLDEKKVPIVYVDRIPLNVENYFCVLLDNQAAMAEAVRVLTDRGHKQLAYLSLPFQEEVTPRTERLEAFQDAVADLKGVLPSILSGSEESLGGKIETMLKSSSYAPTAFIASNDTCLESLLRVYKQTGKTKKIDIISIDGYELYMILDQIILTIEHPIQEICERILACLDIEADNIEKQLAKGKQVFRFEPVFISS